MNVGGTRANDWILISINDHETSEYRILPAADPTAEPRLVAARETGLQYDLEEGGDVFFILTNTDGAKDFKIMTAPAADPVRANWRDLVPHEPGRLILSILSFREYLVRLERKDGLPRIVVRHRGSGDEHLIDFDEEAFSLSLSGAYEYDTRVMRFTYSSMTTPAQVFDYDMETRERVLLKTQEVPSGHDPEDYVTRRLMAPSHDGELVPVSLLHRRDTPIDGSAPCLLYGYGSYGITIPAAFNTNCLSLTDRGFVYAIAHVRGGKDKGYAWYEDGKRRQKMNTFLDFIAAARHLVAEGYTAHDRIVAQGGSAGGMLMGAIANMAPEAFGAILAEVPFVDVLTTMLDAFAAPHAAGMAGMGQPDPVGGRLPDDRRLLALRQCRPPPLPADLRRRRPHRPARHLLGAGQMGGAAARPLHRWQPGALQDQHGCRPRRCVGTLLAPRRRSPPSTHSLSRRPARPGWLRTPEEQPNPAARAAWPGSRWDAAARP